METGYRELKESWRKKYNFLVFFYLNVFLACVSFSIVMPSIWKYIEKHEGDENFLATVLLIYSLGEFVGSLLFGYIHNYLATKSCLYLSIGTGLLGSVFYSGADYFEDTAALVFIFTARLLQGLWTGGQQAIEQSYVSEVVDDDHKLRVLSEIGIASVVGFILGPVFGMALSFIEISLGPIVVDKYTVCGYVQFISTFVMLASTQFFFKEIPAKSRRIAHPENEEEQVTPPNKTGVTCCMILCFILFNGFAVQETITTPLVTDSAHKYTDSFDWTVKGAYVLFAGSGVLSVLAFVIIHHTEKFVGNRMLLIVGLTCGLIGWLIIIDFQNRHIGIIPFLIGYLFIAISFPISRIVCFTILSDILGPNRAGGYMGWILAIGAVARMLGPFWAVQSLALSIKLCFGGTALLFFIGVVLLTLMWNSCDRHPYASANNERMFLMSPNSVSPRIDGNRRLRKKATHKD